MKKPNRILIKISGEALAGNEKTGIHPETVKGFARQIKEINDAGIETTLVVGGGNFWRGRGAEEIGMDRVAADNMGMLATIMNGIAMQEALESLNVDTRLQTAIQMPQLSEAFIRRKSIRHLEKGRVVIFAGGTGSPYFSTDSASALRAAEIKADCILMSKNGTAGVYTSDPKTDPNAKLYKTLSYKTILERNLQVMDQTAAALCRDNNIDVRVFDINIENNIVKAAKGEDIGTLVSTYSEDTFQSEN